VSCHGAFSPCLPASLGYQAIVNSNKHGASRSRSDHICVSASHIRVTIFLPLFPHRYLDRFILWTKRNRSAHEFAEYLVILPGRSQRVAVARRARVSEAAPYHHFASKAALVDVLVVETLRRLVQALQEAVQATADTALNWLVDFCDSFVVIKPNIVMVL
jgi:hypothetical protein